MSATSETEVCNLALTRIGHNQITDISSDTSKAGDLCRLHFPRTRDAVLRAHPWNFAVRRAALAASTTTPNHEYTYAFTLPSDPYCLKVIRTSWEALGYSSRDEPSAGVWAEAQIPYRIEGRSLLANESACSIEYIARVTDTSTWDALFTDAVAARLSSELCMPLTDNQSATKTMWDIYMSKLAEARTVDSQEGSPREIVDVSPWILVRN
jgi:hypothetical protein